jgi:hypothetical protein
LGCCLYWNRFSNNFGLVIHGEYIDSDQIAQALLSVVGGVINEAYLKLFDTSLEDVLFHLMTVVQLNDKKKSTEAQSKMQSMGLSLEDFEIDG